MINASRAITDEYYYNENVIDSKRFPPHLSLHICTVPRDKIHRVVDNLEVLIEQSDLPNINPAGVEPSYGGYVMLNVERTAELMALHEAILDLAASVREGRDADNYGSDYIRDSFLPHFSLAKLDHRDLIGATDLARRVLDNEHTTQARTLDLCDIGARSERWDVRASFPTEIPPSRGADCPL